jgi:hypothetical protein
MIPLVSPSVATIAIGATVIAHTVFDQRREADETDGDRGGLARPRSPRRRQRAAGGFRRVAGMPGRLRIGAPAGRC